MAHHNAKRHARAVVDNAARQMNFLDSQPVSMVRGGLQGGREEAPSEKLVTSVWTYLAGRWPDNEEPDEPEVFWLYWLNDSVVDAATAWNDAVKHYTREWVEYMHPGCWEL